MSLTDQTEGDIAKWIAGEVRPVLPTHARLQLLVASTGLEDGTYTIASYAGYAPVALALDTELSSSGSQVLLTVVKRFPAIAGSALTPPRIMLEESFDGGATYKGVGYNDTALSQQISVGGIPEVPANTGFVLTLE
jgi:hypothetical protein